MRISDVRILYFLFSYAFRFAHRHARSPILAFSKLLSRWSRVLKNLVQIEIAWISLKIGGVLHFGVPCTGVALECPNASWLVKTDPNHPAPGNLDDPGQHPHDPKIGLLAWRWAKRDPNSPRTKVGNIVSATWAKKVPPGAPPWGGFIW
jgi:hypothetical protein